MTTLYVSPDGASGAEKTITSAVNKASPGDLIVVYDGVYKEKLNIDKADLVIAAAEGNIPSLVGGWHPGLFGAAGYVGYGGKALGLNDLPSPTAANAVKGGWPVFGVYAPLVKLAAPGVTLRGLTVRNACGRLVVLGANNVTLEDCVLDFCYGTAILAAADNALITGCRITRASYSLFDPTRFAQSEWAGGPAMVQAAVIVKGKNNVVFDSALAYCGGEGFALDKAGYGGLLSDCLAHTNNHWSYGVNDHDNATITGCVAYWCENVAGQLLREGPADLVTFGDEVAGSGSVHTNFSGNVFIGGRKAFNVGTGGRPFGFRDGSYVGHNTIIGGAHDYAFFWPYNASEPHDKALVENNIIWSHPGNLPGVKYTAGGNVVWRNNLGNEPLPFGGAGNVIVDLDDENVLVNPAASPLAPGFSVRQADIPNPYDTTFDADNYRPRPGSPALGAASDGSPAGGVTPTFPLSYIGALDAIEPAPEPEPAPDVNARLIALATELTVLQAAVGAIGAALADVMEQLGEVGTAFVEVVNTVKEAEGM
jgi:hypothetical protein